MNKVFDVLRNLKMGTVLDVATGRGDFVATLQEVCKDFDVIIGIDQSNVSLNNENEQFKDNRIKFMQMDAINMKFDNNSFDSVTISNSLHHFANPLSVLEEMKRVLKPNGNFIVNEMVCDNLSKEQISHKKIHHFAAKIDRLRGKIHNETYPKNELVELVKASGLEDIKVYSYNYPVENIHDEKIIERLETILTKLLEFVENSKEFENLENEADDILGYIKTFGYTSATVVTIIGTIG